MDGWWKWIRTQDSDGLQDCRISALNLLAHFLAMAHATASQAYTLFSQVGILVALNQIDTRCFPCYLTVCPCDVMQSTYAHGVCIKVDFSKSKSFFSLTFHYLRGVDVVAELLIKKYYDTSKPVDQVVSHQSAHF